jgi:hypothetical protein
MRPSKIPRIHFDPITSTEKGIIFTKEKGGKESDVLVSTTTYYRLLDHFKTNKRFKIDRQKYSYL